MPTVGESHEYVPFILPWYVQQVNLIPERLFGRFVGDLSVLNKAKMSNPIEAVFGFHYISESCLYVVYGFVEVGYLDVRKRICHYLRQAYFREICVSCIAFKKPFYHFIPWVDMGTEVL